LGEPVDVVTTELHRCPGSDGVGDVRGPAARERDEFPVGVAAYPYDAVAEIE
jgi:hypothetical protein